MMRVNCMLLMLILATSVVTSHSEDSALDLILLHNNDLHGRFDESTIDRSDCRTEDSLANKCYGGFPRIATLIKRYRNDHEKGNGLPVVYLNGGDTYVGTPWFMVHKHKITAELMSALRPDVGVSMHSFTISIVQMLNSHLL